MRFWYAALYLAGIGAVSHIVGEALPRRWFDAARAPFRPFAWEQQGRLWAKLGVRRWKDLVPDMSRILPDMRPKRLRGTPADTAVLQALLQETCVAETVHWALVALSWVVWVICPTPAGAALWAADVLLFNLPFIVIQRYNRPKFMATLCRRTARTAAVQQEVVEA